MYVHIPRTYAFVGDDGVKKVKVLSGGEKVRCLLSKMMISGANVLIFDRAYEPLGYGKYHCTEQWNDKIPRCHSLLIKRPPDCSDNCKPYHGNCSTGGKMIDKITTYDEYLESDEMARKRQTYTVQNDDED